MLCIGLFFIWMTKACYSVVVYVKYTLHEVFMNLGGVVSSGRYLSWYYSVHFC
jgi:hypothetical protein